LKITNDTILKLNIKKKRVRERKGRGKGEIMCIE
jgi:hypothetical protein